MFTVSIYPIGMPVSSEFRGISDLFLADGSGIVWQAIKKSTKKLFFSLTPAVPVVYYYWIERATQMTDETRQLRATAAAEVTGQSGPALSIQAAAPLTSEDGAMMQTRRQRDEADIRAAVAAQLAATGQPPEPAASKTRLWKLAKQFSIEVTRESTPAELKAEELTAEEGRRQSVIADTWLEEATEPQDGDTIVCELCEKWEVTYDSSRDEQLCEECTKLAAREKLREAVAAEAAVFCGQVEALGLFADQTNSGLSEAVYFEIGDPEKEEDEDAEIVKVRMAAHEARPTYLMLNGSPDFEIGNIGGKQYTQDSDGDAVACLAWLKRKFEK